MNGNQIGAIACFAVCVIFAAMAFVFALFKGKAAVLISGFNTIGKDEREKYDQTKMSQDMRNSLLLWSVLLFAGGTLSYFISFYFAISSFALWIVLFFKEVRSDPGQAFDKYRV